jgi:hypothetical protein
MTSVDAHISGDDPQRNTDRLDAFRFWIDPGSAPPEAVADILIAMSELHQALGGSGLRFEADPDHNLLVAEQHS